MKRTTLLLVFSLALSGCATTNSRWELAAVGASLADIGSTGGALDNGLRETNPLYGEKPSSGKMLAMNVGALASVWYMTRSSDSVTQQKAWRAYTILRLLAAGWNLGQSGCACFKLTF